MIAKLKRFIRKWWWLILLGSGIALYVAWKVFGPRDPVSAPLKPPPKFIELARTEVEKVHLEGEVEKAKIRTRADVQREQIAAIEEKGKKDPAAARMELADFLAKNL